MIEEKQVRKLCELYEDYISARMARMESDYGELNLYTDRVLELRKEINKLKKVLLKKEPPY